MASNYGAVGLESCRHCKSSSFFVDWKAGDRVCTNCGVVDEEKLRDSRPEWRDFDDAEDLAKGLSSSARCGLIRNDEKKYIGGLQPTILSRNDFGGCYHGISSLKSGSSRIRRNLSKTHRKIERMIEKKSLENVREMELERKLEKKEVKIEPDNVFATEKWSLSRALYLHGNEDEFGSFMPSQSYISYCKENQDALKQLDASNRNASLDVYRAYSLIISASKILSLPLNVREESIHLVCQYAMRRNGFNVKGVSKRSKEDGVEKKKLRDENKRKQIVSLCSAVVYVISKKLGYGTSLVNVCKSFNSSDVSHLCKDDTLKPKHSSKAVAELKIEFPGLIQSLLSSSVEAANLVESSCRKLNLPNLTIGAIRHIIVYFGQEFLEKGLVSGVKPSTVCTAFVYFVCLAGEAMQRLAHQALEDASKTKKRLPDIQHLPPTKKLCLPQHQFKEKSLVTLTSSSHFDVFTTKVDSSNTDIDVLQGWYSWSDQKKWTRTLKEIELSSSVPQNLIYNFYTKYVHTNRTTFLQVIQEYLEKQSHNNCHLVKITTVALLIEPSKS